MPVDLQPLLRHLARREPARAAEVAEHLRGRIREVLSPRLPLVASVQTELAEALPSLDQLDDALLAARNRLYSGPIHAEMTVHAAHARHPGVRAIFAAHGLPACPDCAVGRDETLAEAAAGEGFSFEELFAELQALESGCAR